jgi:hypothetical protein
VPFAGKPALKNRFGSKRYKTILVLIGSADKSALKRFCCSENNGVLGGEHRLFAGRRFSPPMTTPFLGKL